MKLKGNFLIIFFIVFIYIPLFGLIFNIQDGLENTEKRNMAEFPKFHRENLGQFTDEFFKYFKDNFGFRYNFMKFASNLKIKVFKTYPKNIDIKVLKGQDDWLFYKLGNETEDFEGRVPFSKEKTGKIIKNNKIRAENLSPAKFYIFIPPDKTVIYSEFLPKNIQTKENTKNSRITQLLNTDLKIIYPKNILRQNKDKGLLYFKTDTHWTYLGAYFGYRELMTKIEKDFENPLLKPLGIDEFSKAEYVYNKPDLANMANIGNKNKENSCKYLCKENPGKKSDFKVLIFGDSFYEYLNPFLECTFKDVKFVNSNTVIKKEVKLYRPDIVILEIVQRNIRQLEISDK